MGGKDSVSKVEIPKELKPIYEKLGTQWSAAMGQNPLMGPEPWFAAGQSQWPRMDPTWGSVLEWQAPQSNLPPNWSPTFGKGGSPAPVGGTPPSSVPGPVRRVPPLPAPRPVTRGIPTGPRPRKIKT